MTNPFRRSFSAIRYPSGNYVDNEWAESGNQKTITIKSSVQPLNMKEKEALVDGERTGEMVKIYSDERLYPALQDGEGQSMQRGDRLIYDNREWEIISCSRFQSGIISNYKSYAVRVVGN